MKLYFELYILKIKGVKLAHEVGAEHYFEVSGESFN